MNLHTRPEFRPPNVTGRSQEWLLDLAARQRDAAPEIVSSADLELAIRHGLTGLMADSSSAQVREIARPVYARLRSRQAVMERHVARLLATLHEAGLPATVLKGPHIAAGLYEHPGHRTFTDVDLLVRAQDVETALSILADDPAVASIPPKTPKADKRNVPMSDASGVGFNLDLHWDLFSYSQLRGCADGATDWAWEHSRFTPNHPLGPLWELPEEAMVAFLCTHAVLDHRFRLILFRDIAEVARRGPDWDRVAAFAESWQLRSTTYVALLMASKIGGASIDVGVLEMIRPASLPVRAVEKLLKTTDVLHFDGHQIHPLNLAMVLLHDDRRKRLRLLVEAPFAFPAWRRRVALAWPPLWSGRRDRRILSPVDSEAVDTNGPLTLHLLPVDIARGAQTYAEALSRMLDGDLGRHRTMTIFRSDSVALHADIELAAPPGWGRRLGFDVRAAWKLRKRLQRLGPAVVVAHGGESLKYAALSAPRETKLVYYKIGTSEDQLSHWLRRMMYRFFARRCDVVAGVSQEMVSEALGALNIPPGRSVCVPNGRDPEAFPPWQGSPDSSVRFVFVGHVNRDKRPELFVEVIRRLTEIGDDVSAVVVGDGPNLTSVKNQAMGLPIDVLGRREDVPYILSQCDVLLFTSRAEGMPGVLIEASMASLPVVTTEVSGVRTILEEGITGYIVDTNDVAGLVDASHRLVADPELRRRMGEAGRARALSRFTLESSVAEWRRVLSSLIDGSVTPIES